MEGSGIVKCRVNYGMLTQNVRNSTAKCAQQVATKANRKVFAPIFVSPNISVIE
jgi:hypothetical protein